MIACIDVETTGLNANTEHLLEIACLVVDSETLEIVDEKGYHAVVQYGSAQARAMRTYSRPVVQEMHDKTGLWDKLSGPDAVPLRLIDIELKAYLKQFGKPGEMPVLGNSVRLDMNFMDEDLPLTAKHLSYHMRDVSTIAGLAADWYPDLPRLKKHSDHTAMTDIRESIRELRYYRETIFRTPTEAQFAALVREHREVSET